MAYLIPLVLGSVAIAGSAQLQPMPRTPVYVPLVAPVAAGDVNWSIADWRRLRQSSGYAFADYARFLLANPDWPGETTLRRNAERQMRPGENAATVVAFFATEKPTTGNGWARLAESLLAQGRSAEALSAAREAWAAPGLSGSDEVALYQRFGASFSAADFDRRVDRLLIDRDAQNALRLLPSTSPVRRAAFDARIAMQLRSADVEARYNRVMGQVTQDAGLMQDRARYLRDANWDAAARQLLARPHSFVHRPVDADKWYELLLSMAQGAARDGQHTLAYNIARQVDDALPAGANMSLQPLGIRDKYTSLTWLGGTTALRALGRPADAVALFDRYARGGRSLQVSSKGNYWAGRAATQAGRFAEGTGYFSRAAVYPELFYGQLALERLGRGVPAPVNPVLLPSPQQRQAFQSRRLVRALRALQGGGYRQEAALFVRALSESVHNDADRLLATELAAQLGRQDLSVWTARSARNDGSAFYVRQAYPVLGQQLSDARLWSAAHGITRQESSFDRTAVSHAGARGLMQLMPGTAQEQAGKLGYGYDYNRLTSDPAYNVILGSAYFQRLLNQWGGNYPLAIASYNAGAGNVRKWINANGDPRRPGGDIVSWIEDIPFTETRGYVQRVLENTVVYDRLNPPASRQPRQLSYFLGKDRLG
ncbi:MAG TPA: lytic transglycosylase domain-containing protein [Sphingomicrobium sp.]|nr:lytic transglycosylase domain-containing protein [Sphingomicrobium sp.]